MKSAVYCALRLDGRWEILVQYFVDADFLSIYDGLEYVSGLRYQIDITGFVNSPD